MNNGQYSYNYAPMAPSQQQLQQIFPQPQGSVYSISTPSDICNVPIGSTGLSVAICFQEQIMYIKSFQNGSPIIMAYRIAPYSKEDPVTTSTPQKSELELLTEKIATIEQTLTKLTSNSTGGAFNGLL